MTDFLGGVGDVLGDVASTARDFVLPEPVPGGSIVDGALRGVADAVREGPLGLVEAGRQALYGGGSARERLFMGGMALFGAGMGARQLHRNWSSTRRVPTHRAAPAYTGIEDMQRLGIKTRWLAETADAQDYAAQAPHLSGYQHQILGGATSQNVALGLTKGNSDPVVLGAARGFVDGYTQRVGDLATAQVDLVKFDRAAGLLKGKGADSLRKTWGKLETGAKMDQVEFDRLAEVIETVSRVTDEAPGPDLTFGPLGRFEELWIGDEGQIVPVASYMIGLGPELLADPVSRKRVLEKINWTDPEVSFQLEQNLRHWIDIGLEDFNRTRSGQPSRFTKELELGPEWYRSSHDDIARVFGVDDTAPEYPSLVAAVSFLSEAQEWTRNIGLAKQVYDIAQKANVRDADFLSFLREGVKEAGQVHTYKGAAKARQAHQKKLDDLFDTVKRHEGIDGVDKKTFRKVLRLWAGETPESVFATTEATKQKNFYANLLDPDLTYPATVDRHMFDAATGVDFGVTERPINQSLPGGRELYDVLQALLWKLGAEKNLTPNQAQAVIWETFKAFKGSQQFRGGWGRGDPVMLPNLSVDGGLAPNYFFELMNGRGAAVPYNLKFDNVQRLPLDVVEADVTVDGLGMVPFEDGSVGLITDLNEASSLIARTHAPFVKTKSGMYAWGPVEPEYVRSMADHTRGVSAEPMANYDTFANLELDANGGHPFNTPGEQIVLLVEDGANVRPMRGTGKIYELGRTTRSAPERSHARLDPAKLTADDWTGPDSPLHKNAWAVISANVNDIQAEALGLKKWTPGGQHNKLRSELRRAGFYFTEVDGKYGTEEKSLLVTGITPREALELGEKFGQESVITDRGFLYNRDARFVSDVATAGKVDPIDKINFFPDEPGDYYSKFTASDGREVFFAADGMSFDPNRMETPVTLASLTPRADTNVRALRMVVKPGQDIGPLAEQMAGRRGVIEARVYTDRGEIPGFQRAYEHAYSDGYNTRIVRHADGPLGDPHGTHMFVSDASALPNTPDAPVGPRAGDNPDAIGFGWIDSERKLVPITDEIEFQSGAFDAFVDRRGKKVKVIPGDDTDLIPAVRAWRAAGGENVLKSATLETSRGQFDLPTQAALNPKQPSLAAKVRGGGVVGHTRNDRPNPAILERTGIIVDGGYRIGNKVEEVPQAVYDEIEETLIWVQDRHREALDRWGLGKISVSPGTIDEWGEYASVRWERGGDIILSKHWWSDPEAMTAALALDRQARNLSPRVPAGPGGIIAHELGHVLHGAILLEEGNLHRAMGAFNKKVTKVLGGSRKWQEVAAREVSDTAAIDVSELVAEAVSEVWAGNPTPLTLAIYDLVVEELDTKLAFKKSIRQGAVPPPGAKKAAPASLMAQEASGAVTDRKLWGGGLEAMFPSDSLKTPAPFPSVGKHKKLQAFDQSLVDEAVRRGETTQIDPRTLHATQPSVTRDGVQHYIDNPDTVYADSGQAGNQVPVIYRRNEGSRTRNLILSGTHRAAAALAAGRPLTAIVVDGPWGPPR